MRNYLAFILFVFHSCFALKGQDIPVHTSYSAIYDSLDELANQIRRSSRSITSNIAEAWAKRIYVKSFVSILKLNNFAKQ